MWCVVTTLADRYLLSGKSSVRVYEGPSPVAVYMTNVQGVYSSVSGND